jgi:formate hydrogenlyase transcriptional activator
MYRETRELEEEMGYEVFLSDLLEKFVSLPDAQIDAEIEEAIRRIAVFLSLDQGLLVQWAEDGSPPLPTHSWTIAGEKMPPLSPGTEVVPWVHGQTVEGKIVMFSAVDDLPDEAERDKEFFRASGRESLISLPLKINGRVAGALVFASLRHRRISWSEDLVRRLQLLADVMAGILERRKNRFELQGQLQFEMLLSEASTRLINPPANLLDKEILDTLRRVCERLNLDRSTLWLSDEEEAGTLRIKYFYDREGLSAPGHLDAKQLFPWALEKILAGEFLAVSKISELPHEAARDKETWRSYGTMSSLVLPLSTGGSVFGAVSFATVRRERQWPAPTVNRLQLLAQIFSNAVARRHAERIMRENWARLNLAADAANAALFTLEINSGHMWMVEKARKLLGLPLRRELNLQDFLNIIHPEDRDRIGEKVQGAIRTGEDFSDVYRLIRAGGGIRWMVARCRLHRRGSNDPGRLIGASIDITERKQIEEQLQERLQEIEELKKNLENENIYLHAEVEQLSEPSDIVGQSATIKRVLLQAKQVAQTDTTVLLQGETGTGKELLARAIHKMSTRKGGLLVTVNCAALPPALIESELFGREKGAYTGALTRMSGRFEVANGSTLFLDEIGELPFELQGKLLRVIENGCFERLGSTKQIHVDVRLIAASNRDLAQEVEDGRFRRDLFYRLSVFPIVIPPLRERPEDIELMVWAFVKEFERKMGKRIDNIPKKIMDLLKSYEWPGNGRELRNVVEHAMIVSSGKKLEMVLPKYGNGLSVQSLEEMERKHILRVLERTSWRVTGRGGAAEILGLKGTTLQSKMKKLGIVRPAVL